MEYFIESFTLASLGSISRGTFICSDCSFAVFAVSVNNVFTGVNSVHTKFRSGTSGCELICK